MFFGALKGYYTFINNNAFQYNAHRPQQYPSGGGCTKQLPGQEPTARPEHNPPCEQYNRHL